MAYMIYQQLTSAVKEAYAGAEDLEDLQAQTQACLHFLTSLQIDPKLSGQVAEPITYIEEAIRELLVARENNR